MGTILGFLLSLVRAALHSQASLALENAALRQQLGTYLRRKKRPKLRPTDRALWVVLRRVWPGWQDSLAFVKPDTVIGWHPQGFRRFWRRKSHAKKVGRPRIPRAHIELIRRMSRENPGWGEDRIADELRLKLGIEHSTSTNRRYMVRPRPSADGPTWRRFLLNHGREVFACDFLVQHTVRFEVAYVFDVMEVASRRIALINVTRSPTLEWVKGQIREIAAFDGGPRFLVHDNDGIYGQLGPRRAGRPTPTPMWSASTGDSVRRRSTTSSPSARPTSGGCASSSWSSTTGLGRRRRLAGSQILIPSLRLRRRRRPLESWDFRSSEGFNTTIGGPRRIFADHGSEHRLAVHALTVFVVLICFAGCRVSNTVIGLVGVDSPWFDVFACPAC